MSPELVTGTDPIPRSACPACRHPLNTARGVGYDARELNEPVQPGDVACCVFCGAILIVTPAGFRVAEIADLARLSRPLRELLENYSATFKRQATP